MALEYNYLKEELELLTSLFKKSKWPRLFKLNLSIIVKLNLFFACRIFRGLDKNAAILNRLSPGFQTAKSAPMLFKKAFVLPEPPKL